jgi:hypothetical protein
MQSRYKFLYEGFVGEELQSEQNIFTLGDSHTEKLVLLNHVKDKSSGHFQINYKHIIEKNGDFLLIYTVTFVYGFKAIDNSKPITYIDFYIAYKNSLYQMKTRLENLCTKNNILYEIDIREQSEEEFKNELLNMFGDFFTNG